MAQLSFREADHVYEMDGVRIPSVSEILRFAKREVYGTVDQYTLDNAADRGTRVHAACEALDANGTCEVDIDIAPYAEAYTAFLARYKPRWIASEEIVYSETEWYAGRLDRAGYLEGKNGLCIVDIKSSAQIKRQLVQPQLVAYAEAWEQMGRQPVMNLFALHLKKDGKYSLREMECDITTWTAYLLIHNDFKKRGEK